MKRLMVLVVIAIVLNMAASIAPRRGLVVNEVKGKVIVNTHPQQPMELNPWNQPRLNIEMEWTAEAKEDVKVSLSFLSMSKSDDLCPKFSVWVGGWSEVGFVEYDHKAMKGGAWEVVRVSINTQTLHMLAFSKMPLRVRVCKREFFLHKYEGVDLREAFELWRGGK